MVLRILLAIYPRMCVCIVWSREPDLRTRYSYRLFGWKNNLIPSCVVLQIRNIKQQQQQQELQQQQQQNQQNQQGVVSTDDIQQGEVSSSKPTVLSNEIFGPLLLEVSWPMFVFLSVRYVLRSGSGCLV